jgi:hypothetical protein
MGDKPETVMRHYAKHIPNTEGLRRLNAGPSGIWRGDEVAPAVTPDVAAILATPEGMAQFQEFLKMKMAATA